MLLYGYGLIRPATESLFLEQYDSALLPAAWIAVAAFAGASVFAYTSLVTHFSLPNLLVIGAILNASLLIILEILRARLWSDSVFALYIWKDVYIVMMLEIVWSWAHVVFLATTARWAYGLFCAAGSLGSISGNLTVGILANHFGTSSSLLFALPLFAVIIWITTWPASQKVQYRFIQAKREPESLKLRPSSRHYLLLILALVITVQLVITWIDFLYNQALEQHYPNVDGRTAMAGRVYATIDGLALVLQLGTGILVRVFSLPGVLVAIPSMVGTTVLALLAWPGFFSAASTKTISKAMDYSLLKASKEMLYLPLNYGEKTRAKALIDMFGYRSAKGAASLLLLLLISAVPSPTLAALTVLGVALWWALAFHLGRHYPKSTQ